MTDSKPRAWLATASCLACTLLATPRSLAEQAASRAPATVEGDQGARKDAGAEEAIKDKARRLWQEGLDAAEADNTALALARLRESWALYPHVGTLRNLGIVEIAFDDYAADGANHLAYYLAHKRDILPADRTKLEAVLVDTERRLGRLDIDIQRPEASLDVDGTRVGPPLTDRVFYVLPGKHVVVVRKPGAPPTEQHLVLGAGERMTVRVAEESPSRTVPSVSSASTARPSARGKPDAMPAEDRWPVGKRWTVLAGGAFTAIGIGVGVYGEVALSSKKDDASRARATVDDAFGGESACFDAARAAAPVCRRLDDVASDQESTGTMATAAWIGAGAFAVATTAAWLLWPNERAAAEATTGTSVTAMGPWTTDNEVGWVVSGRF